MKPFMKFCLGMRMCVVSDRSVCVLMCVCLYKGLLQFLHLKCGPPAAYAGIGSGCSLKTSKLIDGLLYSLEYEVQGL